MGLYHLQVLLWSCNAAKTIKKLLCWDIRKDILFNTMLPFKADLYPFKDKKNSSVLFITQSNVVVPLKNLC